MERRTSILILALIMQSGCRDADISEMVSDDYTFMRDTVQTVMCDSRASDRLADTMSVRNDSPMHARGQRNAGTTWFFYQPWAAKAYWGKLVRDSLIFLALSALILFLTRKKDGK
ncbi:MAG: hypothetical protein KAR40_03885 [Candidatus Sabulitectum sp.]|nr:hypothetical protein [Candidatus Sabulitectum sp.]